MHGSVLVPKLPLGNPIAGKAPALRENHLLIAPCAPSGSLGESYVPKQELGNEGKAGCDTLSRPTD